MKWGELISVLFFKRQRKDILKEEKPEDNTGQAKNKGTRTLYPKPNIETENYKSKAHMEVLEVPYLARASTKPRAQQPPTC